MSTSLEKARAALKKNKAVDMKNNRHVLDPTKAPVHECISTGSPILDHLIGGNRVNGGERQCPGIPKGRIIEIYGPYSSGKTTVALEVAVQAQLAGGTVCFLDYENALDYAYAQNLGIDYSEDKWDLYMPTTWEEGAEIISALAEAGVDLIIVDSVSAMVPENLHERQMSETGQIGLLARLQSNFLRRLVPVLKRTGTSIIYLNQLRSRIKTSKYDPGPNEDTSGGVALKFYSSLRISLKPLRYEYDSGFVNDLTRKKEKQAVARITRATITKTKVSAHFNHSADMVIRFGEGIDSVRSIMDICEARKIIKKSGAWYKFVDASGEEQSHQGKEALRTYLVENEEHYYHLLMQLRNETGSEGLTMEDADFEELDEEYGDDYEEEYEDDE